MDRFYPEGKLFLTDENNRIIHSPSRMEQAMEEGTILEAQALLCDAEHNMLVDIPHARAVIERKKAALGIAEGTTRDIAILSRVNKPVCFVIESIDSSPDGTVYRLSRVAAQKRCMEQFVSKLECGDVIGARVTHMEPFGAFVDIGCGIPSLIPIDAISVSRISHPNDRFYNGQYIYAAVKSCENGRVCLTHKELLGTWEQNCSRFEVGSTVPGIVRSVESYGIFIEIAPNLAGLAEPRTDVSPGQCVSVNIKSIRPEKMKLKLAIVDTHCGHMPAPGFDYFITEGRLSKWTYSPEESSKTVFTDFSCNTVQ